MTLYEFVNGFQRDFDVYDDVFDTSVTVCYILDEEDLNDDYDRFCIGITKKVEVVKQTSDIILICKWSDLINRNFDKFKAFSNEHWCSSYDDDDEEFVYQWIKEIHSYMAGYVSEDFYTTLVEFVNTLD